MGDNLIIVLLRIDCLSAANIGSQEIKKECLLLMQSLKLIKQEFLGILLNYII